MALDLGGLFVLTKNVSEGLLVGGGIGHGRGRGANSGELGSPRVELGLQLVCKGNKSLRSEGWINNKAIYTAESVACTWAGVVTQKNARKTPRKQMCYRRTNTVGYRVARTRLKT